MANISLIILLIILLLIIINSYNDIINGKYIWIKCAYLYEDLNKDIYMKLLSGHKDYDTKIAKLLRPIYGLKQRNVIEILQLIGF